MRSRCSGFRGKGGRSNSCSLFSLAHTRSLARRLVGGFAVLVGSALTPNASSAAEDARVPFWLGVHANQQIDVQAISLIRDRGAVVVLRLQADDPVAAYSGPFLVRRLKEAVKDRPVMIYGWVTRFLDKGCTGDEMMNWLAREPDLQLQSKSGKVRSVFGDVRSFRYRQETARSVADIVRTYGADGVGIDLAVRTPTPSPGPLARRCKEDAAFCGAYAAGMDDLFIELRKAMGGGWVLYNGLWNFRRGMVEDQARLLAHADGAIVEYFGTDPRADGATFQRDIAPYLKAMDRLDPEKQLFVYGRGSWAYDDYEADYRRQRYMFASYLLASRPNTAFKFQSSFQVPAHAGRSGGLDLYADAEIPLGEPLGPRVEERRLFTRSFSAGRVYVSPQGGKPETLVLADAMYTPEGVPLVGPVTLIPGSALILLDEQPAPPVPAKPIGLESLADWTAARWVEESAEGRYLELKDLASPELVGDHDLLLDSVRTLVPFTRLDLRARTSSEHARLYAVAEVDDTERRQKHVVVCLTPAGQERCPLAVPAPLYRMPYGRRKAEWPAVAGPEFSTDAWFVQHLVGPSLLEGTPYRFRRWAYIRFEGSWQLSDVTLRRSPLP